MRITRREALGAMTLLGATGGIAADTAEAATDTDARPNYPELAEMLARWELKAIQQNHPTWWQKQYYTGLARWSPEVLIFFGVGRPDQVEADMVRFANFLADGDARYPDTAPNVLGMAATPCERAWAIMSRGRVSDCCLDGLPCPGFLCARPPLARKGGTP